MVPDEIPEAARQLVRHTLSTIDHVTVLLSLHTAGAAGHGVEDVAQATSISSATAGQVLIEMQDKGLLVSHDARYILSPKAELQTGVRQVIELYQTRPVTLVRAVYARDVNDL